MTSEYERQLATVIRDNIHPGEEGPLGDLWIDCAGAVTALTPPMTDTEQGDVEKVALDDSSNDLEQRLRGRAAYLKTKGSVKDSGLLEQAANALAALKASPPEGWVMVPVEPTPEIMLAGWNVSPGEDRLARRRYAAMLAALSQERGA